MPKIKLKSCPFCGCAEDNLEAGKVDTPDAYWDSKMRGESYGYVMCYNCGVILKAEDKKDAVKLWNSRPTE